jgi:quercetin dioxygenase-like cupin family protein
MEELQQTGTTPNKEQVREKIVGLETAISNEEAAVFGDDACPLRHMFVDGAYVREITMPKGMVLTSKIHKIEHPFFVLRGECVVITDEGKQIIKAPHWGVTKPGTKRALYIVEETVWVTVHVTKSRDLKEIESEIIAESFDALPDSVKLQLREE